MKAVRYLSLWLIMLLFHLAGGAQPVHQWKGRWITASEDSEVRQSPLLRKTFTIRKVLASARLYSCGLGYPLTTMNGRAITNSVLDQAYTRYDATLLYQTYDVTNLVRPGQNCMGVELGNGWYNMQTHTIWHFDRIAWRKSPRLLLDLVLIYKDGSRDTIASDQSWTWHNGASQFNSMYAGEIYDARKAIFGWNRAGFEGKDWAPVKLTSTPGGVLKPQEMPAVKVIQEIPAVSVKKLGPGRWLFDFGVNFAGVTRLAVSGKRGDTISLYHNEVLDSAGAVDRKANTGHMIGPKADPYFQTDQYIVNGKLRETFIPRFTYHGFRYVELRSSNLKIKVDIHTLNGLFYSTAFKSAGSFSSSDPTLNKLYGAAIRSYRSNYVSIPTDCPAREKMGWIADAWVAAELGLWNFDTASSYRKYLNDIRDVQLPDGNFAGIAPTNRIGYHWIDPEDPDFGPCWASALLQITNSVFGHTGDTAVLRENYAAGKRYIDYALNKTRSTGSLYRTGLGDFLATQETPKVITSSALIYQDTRLLAGMAMTLGNASDAGFYLEAADSIRDAYNQAYFDGTTHTYRLNTVTGLGISLGCGLCPVEARRSVAAQLAAAVRSRDYRADFGVMGTRFVLRALTDNGYADEAYRLLTNTHAGWGRWMASGATTLYEGWEPKDQSYNHVFFGDFAAWYFHALGGLSTVDGFRHVNIQPVFPKGLHRVSIVHKTNRGIIGIRWQQTLHRITTDIQIPKGTVAVINLPGINKTCIAGSYHFTSKLKL